MLDKPKTMVAIDHLDSAHKHMTEAIKIFNTVILDLEKGASFITNYRDTLVKTIEYSGGDVKQAIETQIKDFLPKRLRDVKDQADGQPALDTPQSKG